MPTADKLDTKNLPGAADPTGDRVAIVGIGTVFPGCRDLEDFWDLINRSQSVSRPVRPGRWALPDSLVYQPGEPAPDKVYSLQVCHLDEDLTAAPPQDSPRGLKQLDPLFTLTVRAGVKAWADCQSAPLNRARVGSILGNIVLPTASVSRFAEATLGRAFEEKLIGRSPPGAELNREDRLVAGLPVGYLAATLGISGPHYTLDAACASSLYAIQLACEELLSGRADAMLAGGVSRPDSLYTQMGFCQLRALSPTGVCAPFDYKANGLVVGEGAGVFVLKRLSDALEHSDHIYAVIAGIGLSNDVQGSLLAPSCEGQIRAMEIAYRQAGWDPSSVGLIECHATGTPVGDAVEFQSMDALWRESESTRPTVLGGVKSNVGHLLTAAGAAGLAKALLALQHRTLPPTANFEHPPAGIEFGSRFRVLSKPEPWTDPDRRAAVSAFGFGGINAHVLLESAEQAVGATRRRVQVRGAKPNTLPSCPIAIVGMDAWVGSMKDLGQFCAVAVGSESRANSQRRCWGIDQTEWFSTQQRQLVESIKFGIDEIDVPAARFRIPPNELRELLPQQLLMLMVAARAFEAVPADERLLLNTGVFIGIALDLNTTNFHLRWSLANKLREWQRMLGEDMTDQQADDLLRELRDAAHPPLSANRTMGALGGIVASRVARELHLGGPSHTVSGEENSGLRAVEVACRMLASGRIDQAIVGAVDLAADIRALVPSTGQPRATSEGAAALVLRRASEVTGSDCWGIIRGIGSAGSAGRQPSSGSYLSAATAAYQDARLDPRQVGFVELDQSRGGGEDQAERAALESLLLGSGSLPHVAALSSKIGSCGAASSLLALVRAVSALAARVLPDSGDGDWGAFPSSRQPSRWLRNRNDTPRYAAVSSGSCDGSSCHVVLEEPAGLPTALKIAQPDIPAPVPFCLQANTISELIDRARSLLNDLDGTEAGFDKCLTAHWAAYPPDPAIPLAIVLLTDAENASSDLSAAIDHLGQRPDQPLDGSSAIQRSDWRSRVFFYPQPLRGEVGLVFPGSGNHYPNMGREYLLAFPELCERLDQENGLLQEQFQPWAFSDDRSGSPRQWLAGQVAVGSFVAEAVAELGIPVQATIGYSLGETSALFGLRIWRDRDGMIERLMRSDLFDSQLVGELKAARRHWGVSPETTLQWKAGIIDRSSQWLEPFLARFPRLYLLIVNTPDECVIGGEEHAVDQFLEETGVHFMPLRGVSTVHCRIAAEVEDAYRQLHLFPTYPAPDVKFYSSAYGREIELTSERVADALVAQAVDSVCFPEVIQSAYQDGIRLFLEVGPGSSCTRMIAKILGRQSHYAASLAPGKGEEIAALNRVLAQLLAHRVPIRAEPLADLMSRAFADQRPARTEPVTTGNRTSRPARRNHAATVSIATAGDGFELSRLAAPIPVAQSATVANTIDQALLWSGSSSQPPHSRQTVPGSWALEVGGVAEANARAHGKYLEFSQEGMKSLQKLIHARAVLGNEWPESNGMVTASATPGLGGEYWWDRTQCLKFAVGSIADVLGPDFATIDNYPTRVRLPDEPLMLVDRILAVEGEPLSLQPAAVRTEHDVLFDGWYLDGGRIPTCIAVEAGQADLFLSGYLGIDFQTRGEAVYRLLDAVVTFHRQLPGPGEVIHYDIRILKFFQHGGTWFFHFEFDGSVDGRPLLTMRNGCAGFFGPKELAAGKGVVQSTLKSKAQPGIVSPDWKPLVTVTQESYDRQQLNRLRCGDLAGCFGQLFDGLAIARPLTIPGGLMDLVDRVQTLEPEGGRFGLGLIRAEADIDPDDWFLRCHFVDDRVMPGTLMYECCLHTLRILLLRMGVVGEEASAVWEPVPEISSQLKCRGQVTEQTRTVTYEVSIKELGYRPEPYVIADALMYADGKPIVEITNMCHQLAGVTREDLLALWSHRAASHETGWQASPALYGPEKILAFAIGKPSEAFGEPYRIFDQDRVIARLPGPPYQFLDRIVQIEAPPWEMNAGGSVVAEYDVPNDGWYFRDNADQGMPYAVLLEVALQPCGWFAAYMGSALRSREDLSFRNLGGNATQLQRVDRGTGMLRTEVRSTKISSSGGMIIQNYDYQVRSAAGVVFEGDTYFGFFSADALAKQVGLRGHREPKREVSGGSQRFPQIPPYPTGRLDLVDRIEAVDDRGGPARLGYVRASTQVDPGSWFFAAHFHQDPVIPGSLGLESMLHLLKFMALRRWTGYLGAHSIFQAVALRCGHSWTYRGQVLPSNRGISLEVWIAEVDEQRKLLRGDGVLSVDGLAIYEMKQFSIECLNTHEI